jgi:hypothetical protein
MTDDRGLPTAEKESFQSAVRGPQTTVNSTGAKKLTQQREKGLILLTQKCFINHAKTSPRPLNPKGSGGGGDFSGDSFAAFR